MNMEKVIKGLECHRIDNNHRIKCADCPYYVDDDNHIRCVNVLHDDAIALLKEQIPQLVDDKQEVGGVLSAFCPSCGRGLYDKNLATKYCYNCGQAVKWE